MPEVYKGATRRPAQQRGLNRPRKRASKTIGRRSLSLPAALINRSRTATGGVTCGVTATVGFFKTTRHRRAAGAIERLASASQPTSVCTFAPFAVRVIDTTVRNRAPPDRPPRPRLARPRVSQSRLCVGAATPSSRPHRRSHAQQAATGTPSAAPAPAYHDPTNSKPLRPHQLLVLDARRHNGIRSLAPVTILKRHAVLALKPGE